MVKSVVTCVRSLRVAAEGRVQHRVALALSPARMCAQAKDAPRRPAHRSTSTSLWEEDLPAPR